MTQDVPAFLFLSLIVPASLMPSPVVIDIDQERKDINDLNKGLNLREGDIMEDNSGQQRSAILGDTYRWNKYVPYVLDSSLDINDKGVILRAFEELSLKACIDFKPWTTELNYISVEKQSGCWSYIGKQSTGKQQLSIGSGCGYNAIVQHEFLHALGFYHEQSRFDRDNYVTIVTQNIISGYEHNFNKVSEQVSTLQGTPYDYLSVMHYGKNDFSNGNGSTIITKLPEFQDLIGQRYDISYWDAYELNKLYNCNASISFLDHCSFNNVTMCQMSTCTSSSSNSRGWERVSSIPEGPFTDHTSLGSQSANSSFPPANTNLSGPSFFMHFSTKDRQPGESGRLESRIMKPQRDCHVQCLEFFYFHSGNETDQLNIWMREYQNEVDTTGALRLMDHITGPPTGYWQFHQVPLNSEKSFLVEFEARKGLGVSTGGFSVDDINLSETECSQIWQIRNFYQFLNNSPLGSYLYSPLYYSAEGYRYQVLLRKSGDYISLYVRLVSGVYDNQLQWPCQWRQVTFMLLDQNPNIQHRMSHQRSITTNPADQSGGIYVWDNPSVSGTSYQVSASETVKVGPAWGFYYYISKNDLSDREFVKGGDLILQFSMQNISALQGSNSLPCARVSVRNFTISPYQGFDKGSCATRTIPPPPTNTIPPRNTTNIPRSTTTTGPRECLDIFCSSANIVHSSVTLLLVLFLLVVN